MRQPHCCISLIHPSNLIESSVIKTLSQSVAQVSHCYLTTFFCGNKRTDMKHKHPCLWSRTTVAVVVIKKKRSTSTQVTTSAMTHSLVSLLHKTSFDVLESLITDRFFLLSLWTKMLLSLSAADKFLFLLWLNKSEEPASVLSFEGTLSICLTVVWYWIFHGYFFCQQCLHEVFLLFLYTYIRSFQLTLTILLCRLFTCIRVRCSKSLDIGLSSGITVNRMPFDVVNIKNVKYYQILMTRFAVFKTKMVKYCK